MGHVGCWGSNGTSRGSNGLTPGSNPPTRFSTGGTDEHHQHTNWPTQSSNEPTCGSNGPTPRSAINESSHITLLVLSVKCNILDTVTYCSPSPQCSIITMFLFLYNIVTLHCSLSGEINWIEIVQLWVEMSLLGDPMGQLRDGMG